MRLFFLAAIATLFFSVCKNSETVDTLPPSKPLDHEIPLLFGVNNNFPKADSMLIQIKDQDGKIVFENKGYHPVWGLLEKGNLKMSGRYEYYVKFYSDSSKISDFTNHFDINGDEERIDFSVNLSPYLPGKGAEVYLNKYYGNKFHVEFIRNWEPQKQYNGSDSIAPAYELKNNSDSVVYGIYRVQSSTFATHWVRLHYAASTRILRQENNKWIPLPVNSCVIEAKIEKGKTGKPYPDVVYKMGKKELNGPGKFRIDLEYGVNDAITRMPDSLSKTYPNLYYEAHIYRCTDEFELNNQPAPKK